MLPQPRPEAAAMSEPRERRAARARLKGLGQLRHVYGGKGEGRDGI